ncbi:MAG: hypothetical protein HQK60_14355, partial [Deltaproteobacteria bacterium]|nr:hypothetical protein [Deltaproteobacteria bacterium]
MMLSRAGKLYLTLKNLEGLDISTFNNRKALQKTIYILSEMGINFGYPYNWYLHGPYSPALADDAYEIEGNQQYYDEESSRFKFRESTQKIIDNYKDLFKDRKEDTDWLELVSSLLFLRKHYGIEGE